ncbi:helix-turn-helix domain-containing protein [Methanolobus sp. WCC4]|uniref:helix-turn-helix domain-containing protein n=1 Tax=Methanolobus sp. WCC4 TaxID=3125784 RepID=UPI0030F8E179
MSDLHNNSNNEILEYLRDMNDRLRSLELRVIELESRNSPDVNDKMAAFLTVPDSIRKSLFAVSKLTSCTADEVSEITGRHRSIENKYLNELYRAGWLERERRGKKIYYSLSKKADNKNNEYWSAVEEVENKLDQLLG